MPSSPGPPVLVLGEQVTALGALRSLARAGLEGILVGSRTDFAARSRHCHGVIEAAETADPAALGDLLDRAAPAGAVVLPCSDTWSTAAATLSAEVRERFPTIVPPAEAQAQAVDKEAFAHLLQRCGLPHPETADVRGPADLAPIARSPGRYFLKPTDSQSFSRRFGRKAFQPHDVHEAEQQLEQARAAGIELVLQELVAGPPTAHVFLDGYIARDGRPLALFARRRLRNFPLDFGNSTASVSIPVEQIAPAAETVRALLDALEYTGIFSVELKHDARDGLYKVIELNARPWWYVDFASSCGVNVCELGYRDVLGLPLEPVTQYDVGRRTILVTSDARAMTVLRRRGDLSFGRWPRELGGAHQPIFGFTDPLPALAHTRQVWRRR